MQKRPACRSATFSNAFAAEAGVARPERKSSGADQRCAAPGERWPAKLWLLAVLATLSLTSQNSFASDLTQTPTAATLTVSSSTGRPSTIDAGLVSRLAATMAAEQDEGDRFHAEVWLAASEQRLSRYLKTRDERLALLKTVYAEAHRQALDPDLVLAVMQIESAFDRYAISRVGAQGLMQVMPFWRLEIGRPQDNLTDMATNVRYGTTILAHYLDIAKDDLVDALGRYNGSRGKLVYPEKVLSAWRQRWRNKTAAELPALIDTCARYRLRACRYN